MKQFNFTVLLFTAFMLLAVSVFPHAVRAEDKSTEELAKEA